MAEANAASRPSCLKYRLARETELDLQESMLKRLPTRNAPFASSAAGLKNEHRPGACWSDRLFRRRGIGFTRQHTLRQRERTERETRSSGRIPDPILGAYLIWALRRLQPRPIRPRFSWPALTMTGRIFPKAWRGLSPLQDKPGVPRGTAHSIIRAGDTGSVCAPAIRNQPANGSRALRSGSWL